MERLGGGLETEVRQDSAKMGVLGATCEVLARSWPQFGRFWEVKMEAKIASSGNPAPRGSWKALGLDFGSMLASILASQMALETA